jgi:hypothetical protein
MSAPNNELRTPQTFHAPIPRSPALNFRIVEDETGTEWCESLDAPRQEAKESDDYLAIQAQYDANLDKQIKDAEEALKQQYRQRIFKNVLDGSIPKGNGKK